ncbi:hypothetical protein ILUMI_00186 [Ignelater luminosus]|uniref:Phosphoenolpyruvate synthase n=1 Tax=Ignelater luminosus TaxID=2038154 RepID=A0A8K0DGR1_IGNLU|nr:hypothetical protein ILUMI_00186 [Ignelater luminosus]
MAVVIQRMIPADAAGVLFTCHPTTCNPSKMIITSNYGLGESVVSGQADPDTITINRTWDGDLSVESQQIGTKKIAIKMSEDLNLNNTTEVNEISEERAKRLSLTQEQILILGKVGLELEKAYGSPRDVEWAFCNNKLYLLQSRPITTLNNWTEFELLHEFDVPILTHQELFTVSNVAEVMPGALTPLSNTVMNSIISKNLYKYIMEIADDPFIMKCSGVINHHAVINVTNCLLNKVENKVDIAAKVLDMAVFGHPVTDEKLHAIAVSRFGVMSKFTKYRILLKSSIEAFRGDNYVRKAAKLAGNFKLQQTQHKSALDKFNSICHKLADLSKVTEYHSTISRSSIFYQIVAMNILAEGSKDLTMDHYYDISILLSSCSNVISVEIPQTLEKISNLIIRSDIKEKFIKINPNDGVNWLRISCPQASQELDAFLGKHGHRSLREFEFKTDSWGMNPAILIEMLQRNCRGNEIIRKNEYLSADETIAKLVTPRNDNIRKVLKFLIGRCRKAVAKREATKSELIRMTNEVRLAFRDLSKQMVSEGIIPDAELIYYFSVYELKQTILRRDPALIRKVLQRQRFYPKWDRLKLPELIFGFPKLEEDNFQKHIGRNVNSQVSLKGTPACSGDVTARACVITDLKDIDQLKAGDVLITYTTDVGWSPYFPILSAVVTELGGLISHGAVVAREYGLPCLVGVQNVTSVFKTGDIVHVSGKSGILELIS